MSTPFNVRISLSGLLLLALHCTPSVAQDTVPDTSEESTIVVEGSRDLDNAREEAERLAREQASEITRAARRGLPLERHHLPVCPFVNGMNDAVSEFIVRRMKSNAASIGVEAGGADCSKNIFVGLVSDVEMEVAALLKDEAWAFGELRRYQIDRAKPAQAGLGMFRSSGTVLVHRKKIHRVGSSNASVRPAAV